MTSVAPARRAAPHMTHTPDSDTALQSQAAVSAVEPGTARPRLRDQIAENPLLSLVGGIIVAVMTLVGTAFVAVLLFALNGINDRLDALEARMDRLEAKVDAGFAAQGAQIAELDARLTAQIVELDARLTAQIVELDARLTAQIAELDARLTAQIAELDARLTAQIVELDARLTAQIAALDRKLTALVAHLNATAAVEAALDHRLLTPDAGTTESEGRSPG